MELENNKVKTITGIPVDPCVFCNSYENNEVKYGKIHQYEHIVTHYYCLLLSSNMAQLGEDNEGIFGFLIDDIVKELKRGSRLICSYCKRRGATLGCCNKKCRKVFHLPCGLKENSHHQFFGEFKSYCISHRPHLPAEINKSLKLYSHQEITCVICYENIDYKDKLNILWAPCCKKSSLFHRDCVQQLALSAGYFFKCPLCNNKTKFQNSMLQYGIYIPHQDASWELEPNAFQELLYRHNKCDALACLSSKGREYSTTDDKSWEILLCRTCGSQGTHRQCLNLSWDLKNWDCSECSSIIRNSKNNSITSTTRNRIEDDDDDDNEIEIEIENSNSSSDSDSDSDSDSSSDSNPVISIEDEELNKNLQKLPDILPVALKPGPKSAKLKQIQSNSNINTNNSLVSSSSSLSSSSSAYLSLSSPSSSLSNASLPHFSLSSSSALSNESQPKSSNEFKTKSSSTILSSSSLSAIAINTTSPLSQQNKSTNQNSNDGNDDMEIMIDDHTDNNNSISNIKIVNVSSLYSKNDTSSVINIISDDDDDDDYKKSNYIYKRKADSSIVVSKIIARINDILSEPDKACPKKPRLEEYTCNIKVDNSNFITKRLPSENDKNVNYPVLRCAIAPPALSIIPTNSSSINNNNNNLKNQVSTSNALVNVHGEDFMVPIDSKNFSNYIGDAGTGPARESNDECTAAKGESMETTCSKTSGRRNYFHQRFKDTVAINCKYSSGNYARSNFNRLMSEPILINDLKFRIDSNNTLLVNVCGGLSFNVAVNIDQQNNYPYTNVNNNLNGFSQARGSLLSCNNSYDNSNIRSSSGVKSFIKKIIKSNSKSFLKNKTKLHIEEKDATKENLVPEFRQNDKILNTSDSHNSLIKMKEVNNKNHNILINSDNHNKNTEITSNNISGIQELDNNDKIMQNDKLNHEINSNYLENSTNSLSSKLNLHFNVRVSIDLKRIQPLIDLNPNLFLNKKSLFRSNSMDNLYTNNNKFKKLSKRSQSCDNTLTKTFHNHCHQIR